MRACLIVALTLIASACGPTGGEGCETDTECASGERCSDGTCVPRADTGPEPDAGSGDVDAGATSDAGADAGPIGCAEDCGDGVCVAGACCEAIRACDSICCGASEVCSFGACVEIGRACQGVEDCDPGDYCELSLGEPAPCASASSGNGQCLPRPPACPDGTEPDPENPECIAACSFIPDTNADFDLSLAYSWGEFDGDNAQPNPFDVRSSPIVINLDDDDCDGQVTARDIPEIVVLVSPNDDTRPNGTPRGDLVALSVNGPNLEEKWRVPAAGNAWSYPAAGNIDGLPGNEVVVCTDAGTVVAYHVIETGFELLWTSPSIGNCTMPSLADLDQDGDVEVVTRFGVLNGVDGTLLGSYDTNPSGLVIVADVDNDPMHVPEVVSSSRIYSWNGSELTTLADNGYTGNHVLVAQLDGEGPPEIVALRVASRTMTVWRYDDSAPGDFVTVRQVADINQRQTVNNCPTTQTGFAGGGGPPTAGDVDGDGTPDIAVAGGIGYAVLDGAALVDASVTDPSELFLWDRATVDCSSAQTGSSVFDFNGDGSAEVLYADEHTFYVYDSADGEPLYETCNTNGTILEQPIVADVDNDGQADVVVVSNARYRSCLADSSMRRSGVRVFSSSSGDFVRTRRIWNQHAYSITNVEEDGTIPAQVTPSWAIPELNNFRLNRQPGNQFAAADVVVSLAPRCTGGRGIFATVRNLGEALVPAGARVQLYRGTPPADGLPRPPTDLLGEQTTEVALYPAQAEVLAFPLTDPVGTQILVTGTEDAYAVVTPPAGTVECRADNGVATLERRCTLR